VAKRPRCRGTAVWRDDLSKIRAEIEPVFAFEPGGERLSLSDGWIAIQAGVRTAEAELAGAGASGFRLPRVKIVTSRATDPIGCRGSGSSKRSSADRMTRRECRHPGQRYNPASGSHLAARVSKNRTPVHAAASAPPIVGYEQRSRDACAATLPLCFCRRSPQRPAVRRSSPQAQASKMRNKRTITRAKFLVTFSATLSATLCATLSAPSVNSATLL
jgi:hypothetical protein